MKDILQEIVATKRAEVDRRKRKTDLQALYRQAETPRATRHSLQEALRSSSTGIISEFKRRSPSKGDIHPQARVEEVVPLYEQSGASAVSILTDEFFFGGSPADFCRARKLVTCPLLRKEFIIDEYQIHRAREIGASAVLLIASVLSDRQLGDYRELAESLGMSALVEAHTADEVERAVSSGASVMGINNRDLGTFRVDIGNSLRLRDCIPDGVVCVSESGISGSEEVRMLADAGFDAVLVGEAFMRSPDRRALMEAMRS